MVLQNIRNLVLKRSHTPRKLSTFEVVFANIKNRASITKYQNKDVPLDVLEKILLAGIFAPSAGNFQPWEFVVVRNKETKEHLTAACFDQAWMTHAPVMVVVCINMRFASRVYGERGEKLYGIQDTAAACENILLSAQSLGLGSCWVGAFSEAKVSLAIESPEYVRPCAIIALGWPAEEPPPMQRHPLDEVVHFEKFGETPLNKRARPHHIA